MSLTLWEYFWTEADWVAAPPSVSTVAETSPPSMFGSKGGDYHPLPDDFWEIRAHYLARHVEPVLRKSVELETSIAIPAEPDLPLEKDELFILQHKRNIMWQRALAASSESELKRTSDRVIKLSLDIIDFLSQYYWQAAIILLLDIL
jgi:hypothetical protein